MFSKSKRFPEGSNRMMNRPCITELVLFPPPVYFSAGKDYIPGPGEYEVLTEDSSRHKRYGFLTQTNRFSEGPGTCEKQNIKFHIYCTIHNIFF